MKILLHLLLICTLLVGCEQYSVGGNPHSEIETKVLQENSKLFEEMWHDWTEKPPVKKKKLKKKDILGVWEGHWSKGTQSYNLRIELKENGIWKCNYFRGDGEAPTWYLFEDMVYLFEGPISHGSDLATSIFKDKEGIKLMNMDIIEGFIFLKQIN